LIRSFGYTDFTLRAKNAAIPIIYYLYHRDIYVDFAARKRFEEDREVIKKWLHVVSLKRVFGAGGADGTLSQIRKAFTQDVVKNDKIKPEIVQFPSDDINKAIRADTSVGEDFIEELLFTQKDDLYAFSILALLYPHLDYRNNDFHKDHLHPISGFNAKEIAKMEFSEEVNARFLDPQWHNSIINLQMLDSNENMSKQDKNLADWINLTSETKDRALLLDRCLIPHEVSLAFTDFFVFAEKRRTLLKQKLMDVLK